MILKAIASGIKATATTAPLKTSFFTFDETVHAKVQSAIEQNNGLFMRIKNMFNYMQDFLINSKKSKIITFSGVDGAGKTTILREFTELLEKKYRRNVVELRHRP